MQAPITKSLTTTSGGLTATLSAERTVNLTNPNDPLSLTSLTDTVTLNGRTASSVYTPPAEPSPAPARRAGKARPSSTAGTADAGAGHRPAPGQHQLRQPRPPEQHHPRQRRGRPHRQLHYNTQGYLNTVTDPLGRTASYAYDAAGRVTTQTLPDGRQIHYSYDVNGNLISLTPPGRPAHTFSYTAVDLTEQYTPPTVAARDPSTVYATTPISN